MSSKIMINAVDTQECRIAKIKDNKLEEFHIETSLQEITQGNIYKGVITRVEPSLQAVFVEYGAKRHGFLQKQEIHPDYYQNSSNGNAPINSIVRKGQEILVQIIKDPYMKKGAMLSTFISLPGRYVVLMPGSDSRGVSRKIMDESERRRLRDIIHTYKMPPHFGIIVRTAGTKSTKAAITKDLDYLLKLWNNIKSSVMQQDTPALLYKERSLVLRSTRDYLTPEISEILVDDKTVYHEIRNFLKIIAPKQASILKLHRGEKPIFTKYELEHQIASIFENRVALKSGGSIVIEQTEALVAIDVNSGKATKADSIEKTARQTNIEAAEEIARQLRLRDLGGLIVLDFIDMREQKNRMEVERALRKHLKTDKARSKVGRISQFGLLEMSRQRLRPAIQYSSYQTCKCCSGKGITPSAETMGISVIRKLNLDSLKMEGGVLEAVVTPEVADFLQNHKRREIVELENNRGITIQIRSDTTMLPGDVKIVKPSPKQPVKPENGSPNGKGSPISSTLSNGSKKLNAV